ncbi:MAG: di-heme-cytochrome C peroxidase [Methylococcales bacterium]
MNTQYFRTLLNRPACLFVYVLSGLVACWSLPAWAITQPIFTDQGKNWTTSNRQIFYTQDQGSRIMPLIWIKALKQSNGKPFMQDSLSRYGYLINENSKPEGLPVGFTVNGDAIGMTCAACHTRQIEVKGGAYRIDGGPAIVDFQQFATDLDQAVDTILKDQQVFNEFSKTVLVDSVSPEQQAQLRQAVVDWYLPYHTIMDNALPKDKPWGPARLDAVGMIFNRLAGLDIGSSKDHIIKSNIHRAEAPVRYPFIWNAPIQDKTQWPGFADNGNDLLGLARNLGEVIGVFATFHPQKDAWRVLGVDYLQNNSANFKGLKSLENLVQKLNPPKWPWVVNSALAAQGKQIFESKAKTEGGGCAACHGIRKGATRSLRPTWATPLCYVGTDEKQFELMSWLVDTGELAGAQIPFLDKPLAATGEPAIKVLGMAVIGSILQHASPIAVQLEAKAKANAAKLQRLLGIEKNQKMLAITAELRKLQSKLVTPQNIDLKGAFHQLTSSTKKTQTGDALCKQNFDDPVPKLAYESRVLEGIWATAPYLHNGSIPTLTALLEPVRNRPASFKVGSNYDPDTIGLAVGQTKFDYTLKTTDCSDNKSGNSRCGHEFGTQLTKPEKAALLEYLKIL